MKKRRYFIIFILFSILLFSAFSVFSIRSKAYSSDVQVTDDVSDDNGEDSSSDHLDIENREDASSLNKGQKARLKLLQLQNMRTRLTQEVIKDEDLKERRLTEDFKIKIKSELEKREESFKDAFIKAEKLKFKIQENKLKLKECKSNENKTCKELRTLSRESGKQYLLHIIDAIQNHLNALKSKLQISEELNETEVQDKITKIDGLLTQLDTLKTNVQNAQNKEELLRYAQQLKILLQDSKAQSEFSREYIKYKRIGEIIERAEHLEAKLARIQDKFGRNITEDLKIGPPLSSLINQFNEKISDAEEKYYAAKEKFESFKSINDTEAKRKLIKESHELFIEAHQDLKSAHNLLKQIFKLLKSIDKESIDKDIDFNEDKCWSERPLFIPGKDLGYFIWQSKCEDKTWMIAWSGDSRKVINITSINSTTARHHMTGTISSNGEIKDVELIKFEKNDKASLSNGTLSFDAYVSVHFDEIRLKTTGTQLTLDLSVDGQKQTNLVFYGKNITNPLSIPFTLNGDAATETKCNAGQFLVKGTCSDTFGVSEQPENEDDGE